MSSDQNAVTQPGPPRRFLKKGEGLKRFAAYKPPLPNTAKKVERRQTFVRFKLNQRDLEVKQEPAHFLPPDILNDDSINLSTEIPKIAPPKIIHTPIRPSRQALGTITNDNSPFFTDSQINGNIESLFKKIEKKKTALQEREESRSNDHLSSSDCHDKHESFNFEDNDDICNDDHQQPEHLKPEEQSRMRTLARSAPLTGDVARHGIRPRKPGQISDLSKPAPGTSIVALGRQIDSIESTVNELREKLKNCECCAVTQPKPPTTRRRPTTRAAARAAKTKEGDTKTEESVVSTTNNPIEQLFRSLSDNVAQLKLMYDEQIEHGAD